MTNPTPPLTASKVVDIIIYDLTGNLPSWEGGEAFVKSFCHPSITPDIDAVEAYAVQNNADLVESLNSFRELNLLQADDIKRLKAENAELVDRFNCLRDVNKDIATERDEAQKRVVTLRNAIAKKLSQNDNVGFCLLEAYTATQPPKEGE